MKTYITLTGLLLAPTLLSGQAHTTVAPFVAADRMAASDPLMMGLNLGWELGHVGLRWSVATNGTPGSRPTADGTGAAETRIGTDLDAVLFIADPLGNASVIPYASGGLGLRSANTSDAHHLLATWAAGGGVRIPIAGRLAVEGEARHVRSLTAPADELVMRPQSGMEFRAGMSLRIGGRARAPVAGPPSLGPRSLPVSRGGSSVPTAIGRSSRSATRTAQMALTEAERHLGTTYRWGGSTPGSGFDCSGFVSYIYALQGISLPRVSQEQARAGQAVPLDPSAFQPGDLIAFASRGTVDHVAIYAGDGRIIHSSASGGGVRYDDLFSQRGQWYLRHMVAVRRVIPE